MVIVVTNQSAANYKINGLCEPCKESHPIMRDLMHVILRTGVMEVTLSYREVTLAGYPDITNI